MGGTLASPCSGQRSCFVLFHSFASKVKVNIKILAQCSRVCPLISDRLLVALPIHCHNQARIAQRYFAARGHACTDTFLREVRLWRTLMITTPTCEIGKLVRLERETVHCLLAFDRFAAQEDTTLLIPIHTVHASTLYLFAGHESHRLKKGIAEPDIGKPA